MEHLNLCTFEVMLFGCILDLAVDGTLIVGGTNILRCLGIKFVKEMKYQNWIHVTNKMRFGNG